MLQVSDRTVATVSSAGIGFLVVIQSGAWGVSGEVPVEVPCAELSQDWVDLADGDGPPGVLLFDGKWSVGLHVDDAGVGHVVAGLPGAVLDANTDLWWGFWASWPWSEGWESMQLMTGATPSIAQGDFSQLGCSFASIDVDGRGDVLLVGEPQLGFGQARGGIRWYQVDESSGEFEEGDSVWIRQGDVDKLWYGAGLDATDQWLAVGAPDAYELSNEAGRLYMYGPAFEGWASDPGQQIDPPAELASSDRDHFGSSVALNDDGDRVFVGAVSLGYVDGYPSFGPCQAITYMLEGESWVEAGVVSPEEWVKSADTADDDAARQQFGRAIVTTSAGGQDWLFLGEHEFDGEGPCSQLAPTMTDGVDTGAVYVFRQSDGGWEQVQRLQSPDCQLDLYFGYSLAASGDVLAIGAPGYSQEYPSENRGAVYIAQHVEGRWVIARRFDAADMGEDADTKVLGSTVAIARVSDTECRLLAGDGRVDGRQGDGHHEWSIDLSVQLDCNGNGIDDTCEIQSGLVRDDNGDGSPDVCQLEGDDANGNGVPDTIELSADRRLAVVIVIDDHADVLDAGAFATQMAALRMLFGDRESTPFSLDGRVKVCVVGTDGKPWGISDADPDDYFFDLLPAGEGQATSLTGPLDEITPLGTGAQWRSVADQLRDADAAYSALEVALGGEQDQPQIDAWHRLTLILSGTDLVIDEDDASNPGCVFSVEAGLALERAVRLRATLARSRVCLGRLSTSDPSGVAADVDRLFGHCANQEDSPIFRPTDDVGESGVMLNADSIFELCDACRRGLIASDVDDDDVPDDALCPGDKDGDGVVDVNDLLLIVAGYGSSYDVNDLLEALENFGCTV